MHGLKVPESELNFLLGAILVQVSIGQNDLVLWFDNNASLTVASEISCCYATETRVTFSDFSKAANIICEFLGKTVSGLSIGDEGRALSLKFDGMTLRVLDDSDQYESFTITYGDKTFVA